MQIWRAAPNSQQVLAATRDAVTSAEPADTFAFTLLAAFRAPRHTFPTLLVVGWMNRATRIALPLVFPL